MAGTDEEVAMVVQRYWTDSLKNIGEAMNDQPEHGLE